MASLLYYDESSPSCLRWSVDRNSNLPAGSPAGYLKSYHNGRYSTYKVKVNGKEKSAAELVLELHGMLKPTGHVADHIDRNPLNMRISNLRWLTVLGNRRNSGAQHNSKSGVKGVYFNKVLSKWHAQITTNKVKQHLGFFLTFEEAKSARLLAESNLYGVDGEALSQ